MFLNPPNFQERKAQAPDRHLDVQKLGNALRV